MARNTPNQSRVPFPVPLGMSTAQSEPEPPTATSVPETSKTDDTVGTKPSEDNNAKKSPIPVNPNPEPEARPEKATEHEEKESSVQKTRPHPKPIRPSPTLHFSIHDIAHPGVKIFLENTDTTAILSTAIDAVFKVLYPSIHGSETAKTSSTPPDISSVKLILKPMHGVAYTSSNDLCESHKEIRFSLDYISQISNSPGSRRKEEILGVVIHEMVHVFQHWGQGSAPGGLTEGMADYVRLKAGYSPPHWKKRVDCDWDAGYERTAYFLEWLEDEYGAKKVRGINDALCEKEYEDKTFWKELFGVDVKELWGQYRKVVRDEQGKDGDDVDSSRCDACDTVLNDDSKGKEVEEK